MRTVDRRHVRAPAERVFQAAMDVEQWPVLLSHYRWVRLLGHTGDRTIVEMAAWRTFGPIKYPTWWVSEMWTDPAAGAIHYRHIRGITTGMDVVWQVRPMADGADVSIIHEWDGPPWPLIGPAAADRVIGPVFIHGIASRTLAGIARHVEAVGRSGSHAVAHNHLG
jgi:ribosome-associated toxin RatA of RatAB toxin-antitoxin module